MATRIYYTPTPADLTAHVPPTKTWADGVDVIPYVAHVSRASHPDAWHNAADLYLAELIDPPVMEAGTVDLPVRSVGRTPERALELLEKRIVQRTAKPAHAREVILDDTAADGDAPKGETADEAPTAIAL